MAKMTRKEMMETRAHMRANNVDPAEMSQLQFVLYAKLHGLLKGKDFDQPAATPPGKYDKFDGPAAGAKPDGSGDDDADDDVVLDGSGGDTPDDAGEGDTPATGADGDDSGADGGEGDGDDAGDKPEPDDGDQPERDAPDAPKPPPPANPMEQMIQDMIDASVKHHNFVDDHGMPSYVNALIRDSVAAALRDVSPAGGGAPLAPFKPAPLGKLKGGKDKRIHKSTKDVIIDLECGLQPYMYGRRGAGKTTISEQVAEHIGVEFYAIGQVQDVFSLVGYRDATGEYVSTDFYKCFTEGGVFLLDELDRYAAECVVVLNAALSNGWCAFPNGRAQRHPQCYIVGAGNTKGDGAHPLYTSAQAQDGAFMDRFNFHVIDIDETLERQLALDINPHCAPWVEWVQAARLAGDAMGVDVSPRVTYSGAKLLAHGVTMGKVKARTLFNKLNADQVRALKTIKVGE